MAAFLEFHNPCAKVTIYAGLIIHQLSQFIEICSFEENRVTEVSSWWAEVPDYDHIASAVWAEIKFQINNKSLWLVREYIVHAQNQFDLVENWLPDMAKLKVNLSFVLSGSWLKAITKLLNENWEVALSFSSILQTYFIHYILYFDLILIQWNTT